MKQLIIFGLLVVQLAYSQETKLLSSSFEFEPQKIYHLFGDQVKLRSGPGTDFEVIELLPIGIGVTVLEQSHHTKIFKGISSPWVKVKTPDHEGYILGGLIALETVVVGEDEYLASIIRENQGFAAQIRILRAQHSYEEMVIKLPTDLFAIEGKKDLGIKGVSSALIVDFIAEACGVNGGGVYVFNTDEKLVKAFSYLMGSDAGAYSIEEKLIFPNDPEGREDKVLFKREVMELKDIESNWVETIHTERELQWDGERFIPDVRGEK